MFDVGKFEMGRPGKFDYENEYEEVIFLQDSNAEEVLAILENDSEQAALDYLKQWHYPGEHSIRKDEKISRRDSIYRNEDYVMYYNTGLDYIGLLYTIRIPS